MKFMIARTLKYNLSCHENSQLAILNVGAEEAPPSPNRGALKRSRVKRFQRAWTEGQRTALIRFSQLNWKTEMMCYHYISKQHGGKRNYIKCSLKCGRQTIRVEVI